MTTDRGSLLKTLLVARKQLTLAEAMSTSEGSMIWKLFFLVTVGQCYVKWHDTVIKIAVKSLYVLDFYSKRKA